jgi:beta-lactamase class A
VICGLILNLIHLIEELRMICWIPLILMTFCFAEEPADLKGQIEAAIKSLGEKVVVEMAFRDLETGESVLIRADEPIHPASTMKIPVMLEVYRRAEAGSLKLDDRIAIKNSFASIVDGSPFELDPKDDSELTLYQRIGQEATIRELVTLMITESSNLATNILVEKVTPEAITAFMKQLGADGLKVLRGVEDSRAFAKGLNNVGTARGLMVVLSKLSEGSAVSKQASDEMLAILRAQKFNDGIPAGLPPGVTVAHKTGSIKAAYHDAAVVEIPGRKPFILVVMTRGIEDEPKAHKLAADIARIVFSTR